MHKESLEIMNYFIQNYLDKDQKIDILDVGSYNVNGSYRDLFTNNNWKYTGLDIIAGPNVDVVSLSNYDFGINQLFDVVVSGNCLEHVEAPWLWAKEIEKVTKKGGLICIITPFSLGEHRYPVDCWRILPDGYKFLFEKETNFKVLESRINNETQKTKLRFFGNRKNLNWLYNILPVRIKKYFIYTDYMIQDTFVIAIRK
jgi:SAM-dependent methyltransferase